eukprot:UN21918
MENNREKCVLRRLFKDLMLADARIICKQRIWEVHKCVIGTLSKIFKELIIENEKDNEERIHAKECEIIIEGVEPP